MINIGGTGLHVSYDAAGCSGTQCNNGPGPNHSAYSDISITETSNGAGCINVAQAGYNPSLQNQPALVQPRGFHGINCASTSNSNAGIYLDGSNVSLEDVTINGFGDGILIGSQLGWQGASGPVQGDIVFNVSGGSGLTNVVHICGPNYGNNTKCSNTTNPVVGLTLMGITSSANHAIQDDVTDTLLTASSNPTVGMYILGESVTVGSNTGNSRFTTSPSLPTWRVGADNPPTGNCAVGTLYSRISTSSSQHTIWGCTGSSSWTLIK